MKTLTVTLEKQGDELCALLETHDFLYTTVGQTIGEVEAALRKLLADYLEQGGKGNPLWAGINVNDIEFNFTTPHPTE